MRNLHHQFELKALDPEIDGFHTLAEESRQEGFGMLTRLFDNWTNGRNRFAKRGEILLGAWDGPDLAGVCGLSIDPFVETRPEGRVRHLYVRASERRRGAGRLLVGAIAERAAQHFPVLNTRAAPGAFAFYEALGFHPVEGQEKITHRLILQSREPA